MARNRFQRKADRLHPDPSLGRMVAASLLVHLAVALLFAGGWLPRAHREAKPVFYVDLVNLPVKAPQAGRPDARPERPAAETRPEPKPAPEKVAAPPKPQPAKETVKLPHPETAKKPEVKPVEAKAPAKPEPKKPEPAPKPAAEKVSAADQEAADEAIRRMQAKKEREELMRSLETLAAKDTRRGSAVADAPVGMPEGKGSEAGAGWELWIQAFLKANWSLSKYQVARRDAEALVRIVYDARGNLVDYRFLNSSGDTAFDDSVRKAILKEKQLPKAPGERLEIDVVFNLKDLLK